VSATQACARCGVFLESKADLTWSDDGEPMCVACRNRIDLGRREAALARRITSAVLSSLVGALIGLVAAVLIVFGALLCVPAFGTGLWALRALRSAPPSVLAALGPRLVLLRVANVASLVLSGLGVVVLAVHVVLFVLRQRPS